MSWARDHALALLDAVPLPHWPANVLKAGARKGAPDPRDRALAEQLLVGTIKNLLHLQWLLAHYSGRNLRSLDVLVQKIIALGLYQIRFLQRIPAAAAVNEAVEQARRLGRERAAGLVNAVLRNALRQPPPALPDRQAEPARYAELALSHPRGLYARLTALLGPADALRFCEHNNREPPTVVRLGPGARPGDLHAPGVAIAPHEQPGFWFVHPARQPLLAEWAARGVAQAQDPTAALAVEELAIEPGQRVLDRCCGLGTKTVQAQQRAGPSGQVVAMDPSEPRIGILARLVADRGLGNVRVRRAGMLAQLPGDDPRLFDRILIDAPCSNSGVLARRAEARYAQTDTALRSLRKLQQRIIDDTAPAMAPGGRMVYSTCSIWPEENEQQVEALVSRHAGLRLLRQRTIWPSFDPSPQRYHDGGYVALIERQAAAGPEALPGEAGAPRPVNVPEPGE